MSLTRYFRATAALMAILVATSFAAKAGSGKVRSVIGGDAVTRQKNNQGEWAPLKVGNKVQQGDNIRTLLESQAIIALPDGSTISIEENSLVSMSEVLSEDGVNRTTAEIKQGKVRFDVQKQGNKDSHFRFKTGTATAAIRGTEGTIGVAGNESYAALISGLLEIAGNSQTVSITAGQVAFTKGESVSVVDVQNAGESSFMNTLADLLQNPNANIDTIINSIKNADSLTTELINSYRDSVKCEFAPLPDTIYENSVVVKGQCSNGISIKIGAEKISSEGKEIQFTPNWLVSEYGEKKFPITCFVGPYSFSCGQLNTYYANKPQVDSTAQDTVKISDLELKTPATVEICDPAKIDIEGTFNPKDSGATLFVKMGSFTSENLVPKNPKGEFLYSITINDTKNNWNENKVSVEYSSLNGGSTTKTIALSVNKHCKKVNTQKPTLQLGDPSQCKVSIDVLDSKGDSAIFTVYEGNDIQKQAYIGDRYQLSYDLVEGFHDYKFTVEDWAGNRNEISKSMGCYKKTGARLRILGGKSTSSEGGSEERLRVPPTPPQSEVNYFNKMMTFKIEGLPSNNPIYIKSITITQNGSKISNFSPSDFIKTIYDQQIVLYRNKKTTIGVEVVLKSGEILKASKTYEAH